MVVTSQPLAAQAGLRILQQGGNAIDAAVATAAVLNVVEPMMVGVGGDLFAIVYIAKEHKLYVLNASGMAPTGATLAHFNELGYRVDPENWGPASGMPRAASCPSPCPARVWGWDAVLQRFGTLTLQGGARSRRSSTPRTASRSRSASRTTGVCPNALPLRGCCTELDPDSVEDLVHRRQAARGRARSSAIPDLAQDASGCCSSTARDAFYKGEIAPRDRREVATRSAAR